MHVHFEQNTCTRTDSNFLSLSWMGKVPEDLPEEGGGWKLNRAQYYVEGWLASGNARGVVGVTFSTSHCHRYDAPPRSNFNLRGHRSEVILVRWNEPYQKLATCDSRGVIFVWIKHEGRWSIELINDRNSQVTDFAWSHDGRMALICYRDGFILVGSVAGQRYWSSMLSLENTSITCGVWSPDDQQVMFGTLDGQIIVMSSAGSLVTQVTVHEGYEITSMAWSCEKFNMEEAEVLRDNNDDGSESGCGKQHVLAVCFQYGEIFLMSAYDDPCPAIIYPALTGIKMDWSNCGEYLAVGGFVRLPSNQCRNEVHFYSKGGHLIHWVPIPSQGKPLSAMTWGHNDKRLFLAAGCHMYVAWVSKQVAPLNFLCQRVIHQAVRAEKAVEKLPIPLRLQCGVKALFSPTIKSYIPEPLHLREFVCWPPPGGERLFCTMIRHGEETSGGHYTLYLEYLGGLVPLLKGKRTSKLRPDFIIFDPKIKSSGKADVNQQAGAVASESSSESDPDVYTDGCGSPRMQRRRRHKVFRAEKVNRSITFRTLDELMFDDNLPETTRLVEVTSNIWGTKFQITGLGSCLPCCLGQIVYKTSLLHLQPRQMTITISEISPARQVLSRDPNFTPAPASDDEDSIRSCDGDGSGEKTVEVTVHDTLGLARGDTGAKMAAKGEHSAGDAGGKLPIGTSPLIERSHQVDSPDLSSLTGKLTSSGSVRSRSLSPVRNSLTQTSLVRNSKAQTSPAFKTDSPSADARQEGHSNKDWQGARPKTNAKRNNSNSNSSPSPKLNPHICTNRNSSVTAGEGVLPVQTSQAPGQHAGSNGVVNNSSPPCLNNSESHQPVTASSGKKVDFVVGFKRLELSNLNARRSSGGERVNVISGRKSDSSSVTSSVGVSEADARNADGQLLHQLEPEVGVPQRWADPASESIKLLEDEVPGGTEFPFENNLVADCSPTAPFSLDLHRRFYLAQQHLIDTGAPISPTNCPECLPSQFAMGADRASPAGTYTLPGSEDMPQRVLHQNMKNVCLTKEPAMGVDSACRLTKSANLLCSDENRVQSLCNVETKPFSSSVSSNQDHNLVETDRVNGAKPSRTPPNRRAGLTLFGREETRRRSSVDRDNIKPCGNSSSSSLLLVKSQEDFATMQSSRSSSPFTLTSSSASSTSSSKEEISQCHRTDQRKRSIPSPPPPNTNNNTFTTTPTTATLTPTTPTTTATSTTDHAQHSSSAADRRHCHCHGSHQQQGQGQGHGTAQGQGQQHEAACPSHSYRMTKDLSSSEKLAMILSEDPANQNSAHNFQSMPGFFMLNPSRICRDLEDSSLLEEDGEEEEEDYADQPMTCSDLSIDKMSTISNNGHDLQLQDVHQTSASLPSSPIRFGLRNDHHHHPGQAAKSEMLKGRCKHLSPLMHRKGRGGGGGDSQSNCSSSQDVCLGLEEGKLPHGFHNLEAFQKSQLKQKMRRRNPGSSGRLEQGRTFTMHNKAPLWNETSQVYQLDFGGRVTQESAKNFQIELRSKQVMQFGRIDNNAYTLDFQYPFTAVQAFAVALANVTQRLK